MQPDQILRLVGEGAAADAGAFGLLLTAFTLGLRHGLDWDHIAAIVDITSTSGVADEAEREHFAEHALALGHEHEHGGADELRAHQQAADTHARPAPTDERGPRGGWWNLERRPIVLGTLYALGHALVVALLGGAALLVGAQLPDWIDPLMGRIVGLTLVVLGVWVFVSLYQYARHGAAFRLRSRWMLVFDGVRHLWRRFQAWLHGHEHAAPIEMSSYGPRTAFGVGMIHGVGAETGTQVLFIGAVGGAAGVGLGIPMMLAFIAGLVITNSAIVVVTASGFMASQARRRIYLVIGLIAGVFSLLIGGAFLLGAEGVLPNLEGLFGS
jgi:high-affinity nickel-transport protein